jgi:hypothetical protein
LSDDRVVKEEAAVGGIYALLPCHGILECQFSVSVIDRAKTLGEMHTFRRLRDNQQATVRPPIVFAKGNRKRDGIGKESTLRCTSINVRARLRLKGLEIICF